MSDRLDHSPIMQLKQVSWSASMGSGYLLEDISFKVFRGDTVAIIGPSGAGKTSLLRLLNRLSSPTSGSIYLENQDVSQIPIRLLRSSVVLVPQEPKLLGMNVQEALAYPLILQQLPKKEIQQRVEYWRTRLEISQDWSDRNELQLSLGQRQLVAIARALVMQPKILLLDEPTSALDAGNANHLVAVLTQLSNDAETTILMVNHQLELAQKFANRVLYLQDGQLREETCASQLDWSRLRENLVRAEAQSVEEWL